MFYAEASTTRENIIERITIAWNISRNDLRSTVDSFRQFQLLCIDSNGQVFEHLIR